MPRSDARKSRKLRHLVGPVLGIGVFVAALIVLHTTLRRYHYRDIIRDLHALPQGRILLALLFTTADYLTLTGYDSLGLRYIRRPLRYGRIALASFVSYAFSHNLGFPLLTGAPVRFRLYSAWGLSAVEVTNVIAFNSLTFFLGLFTVGGVIFLAEPLQIPGLLHLPFGSVQPVGAVFLAVAAAYLIWSGLRREPLRIKDFEFRFPGTGLSLMQVATSSTDWLLAGSVFWALLPPDSGIHWPTALGIFVLAQAAGLFTNIPGGLGVFEAVVIVLLSPQVAPGAVLGSLVAYRAMYYLLPLVTAAGLFGAHEVKQRHEDVRRVARAFGRWAPVIAPQVLAFTTFVGGALLLVSGVTPAVHSRLRLLHAFLPLSVIEASHFLASMAGVGLLLLARGLQRRLDAAYVLTVALLSAAVVLSLLNGADYEEAVTLGLMLAALLPSHRYFYRRTSLTREPFTTGWVVAIALTLAATLWVGFFSYKHVQYSGDLWWRFALQGDAPRFLRAEVGSAALVTFVALWRLLRPAPAEPGQATTEERARARGVIEASPDAAARLALLGDKDLLFNDARDAFVMYAVEGRSWVAMGDPIGPAPEWPDLLWSFREMVDRHGGWTVFYQVRADSLPLYLDQGLTLLKLGEEARVPLGGFTLDGTERRGMRVARRRMEREGCSFEIVRPEAVATIMPELRVVSDAWLAEKRTREKGFSLGFFEEDYLESCPVALLRCGGRIIAFANVWESAEHEELSVDLMRYVRGAPEEAMEAIFVELMLWGKSQGFRWFNLGMAPLPGLENRATAPLWNRLGALVFGNGANFYSFQGLRQYKQRFAPVWTPKYLASPGGLALPRILTNISSLISRGPTGTTAR